MQFNVSGLLKESPGSVRAMDVDGRFGAPAQGATDSIWDRSFGMRVEGAVSMMRTDAGIWVQATLSCEVVCTCGRCLEPHLRDIDLAVDEEFYPAGSPAQVEEADETQFISPDNVLDLLPTIHQYAALGVPMKPLCNEKCAGMCPGCGVNLNLEGCSCAVRSGERGLGRLRELSVLVQVNDRS